MRTIGKRCSKHGERDWSSEYRREHGRVLCAACYVDEQTSSTRRLEVSEVKSYNDRYAALAVKHGVR